jgi:hypothetical protein
MAAVRRPKLNPMEIVHFDVMRPQILNREEKIFAQNSRQWRNFRIVQELSPR